MAADPQLATVLLQAMLGKQEVGSVDEVLFGYAPQPASDYLDDRTAFDAFIRYRQPDGALAFVGVETKLSEPFSAAQYDKPSYRRWVQQPDSPWLPEHWGKLADVRHNQLWRDHLLAAAMLRHYRSAYAAGRLLVVYHPEDKECSATVARYQRLLRPGDSTFAPMPLDQLVGAWEQAAPESARAWLGAFRKRYLDLGASANML